MRNEIRERDLVQILECGHEVVTHFSWKFSWRVIDGERIPVAASKRHCSHCCDR